MIKCTYFEEILNFNRSYIVYHTYSLKNVIFLTWTLRKIRCDENKLKKNETDEFSSLKGVDLKLQDLIKDISYK